MSRDSRLSFIRQDSHIRHLKSLGKNCLKLRDSDVLIKRAYPKEKNILTNKSSWTILVASIFLSTSDSQQINGFQIRLDKKCVVEMVFSLTFYLSHWISIFITKIKRLEKKDWRQNQFHKIDVSKNIRKLSSP